MAPTMRSRGGIHWRELRTHDTAAARAFYGALWGWRFVEAPSPDADGHEAWWIEAAGRRLGALRHAGQPSSWLTFVTMEDVAATAARMHAAGGAVTLGPSPLDGLGTHAVLQDPEGATLAIVAWDNASAGPADDSCPATGRFLWQTLGVRDIPGAAARFAAALGWTCHPGPDGVLLAARGVPLAEVHGLRGPASRWLPYVAVEDVAETLARAEGAGARTVSPAGPLEGGGAAGVLLDPTGALLGLLEPA